MMNTTKKILILSSNPKGTARLRLDEEVREIEERLRRSKYREQFLIHSKWAVRLRDIRQAMLDDEPQIVHFCGHGEEEGLIVEDEQGRAILVDPEGLADLFAFFKRHIECVVLNACYSQPQAEAINQHIPYVIGMSKGIQDKAAIEFVIGFYDALGAGRPIEEAFEFGCNALRLSHIPEYLTPILKKKSFNTGQIESIPKPVRNIPKKLFVLLLILIVCSIFVIFYKQFFPKIPPQPPTIGEVDLNDLSAYPTSQVPIPEEPQVTEQRQVFRLQEGMLPYYLWYQFEQDSYPSTVKYIEFCSITFDITDVVDDYDFLPFTGQWASLDQNKDGISDQYFSKIDKNRIEWRPKNGCVRLDLSECSHRQQNEFNEHCGAVIGLQPKPGRFSGEARIPVLIKAICYPPGTNCDETSLILHRYSCGFIVVLDVSQSILTDNQKVRYTLIVRNISKHKGNTILTATNINGTRGGSLNFIQDSLKVDCPSSASYSPKILSDKTLQIDLTDLSGDQEASITYERQANTVGISKGEISEFVTAVALSEGCPSQIMVAIKAE
jgi:hypothetical protein